MGMCASVAVARAVYAIDRPYSYRVPPELESRLRPGMRVLVPFGQGNRVSDGLVLALEPETELRGDVSLKDIQTLLDETPVLDSRSIQLALWMRDRYWCTLYDCVRAMLPAGLSFALRNRVSLVHREDKEGTYAAAGDSPLARQLLDLLYHRGGEADLVSVHRAFGTSSPSAALRRLTEAGVIAMDSSARREVGDRMEQIASLALPPEDALALVTPKRKSAPMRFAVTELLTLMPGPVSVKELCYFTGASSQTVRTLARDGILTLERQEVFRRPALEEVEPAGPPVLNGEQQQAFEALDALSRSGAAAGALLYGVTGSGKTQVYLALIRQVLSRGRQVLMMVPEIALTPQMLRIFTAHFGAQIALLHSSLRTAERYDEWKRCRSGDARVVLGTRSAIFAPLEDIGLIILDEEQESSYRSEQTPRYHARDVAKYRCVQHRALLVLGSATPSVESMYCALSGTYRLVTLRERYNRQSLPQVIISDVRREYREGGIRAVGEVLRRELDRNQVTGEQSILFLNRRGASPMLLCGTCGDVPECPSCSVKLTYHSANHRLMCHCCGYSQEVPPACPVCGGKYHALGVGTQRVEEELEELYPGRRILRMDTDTVSATNPHDKILREFSQTEGAILVGTQMVAKGLDFEGVTLVGAVAPDLSLYAQDFRAPERTFSLLTQVVGRAGRGSRVGRAVIQTFSPDHEVIRCAARQDYDSFYRGEIELRRLRNLPPFADLVVLTASGPRQEEVRRCCMRMRMSLEDSLGRLGTWQILGPAPAPVLRVSGNYRYRLTLAGPCDRQARETVRSLLIAVSRDRQSRGVSVWADLDPHGT